jgi:hypothetical protein
VGMLKQGDEVEQEIRETALVSAVPVWVSTSGPSLVQR